MMVLLYFFTSLVAIEIKPLREIKLSEDEETFLKWPRSFIVTEDDMFFIFDSKASNIKIYNAAGKLLKIFGRHGMGPNEFIKPSLSSYKEPYLAIGDYGRKTIFIYKRKSRDSLEFIRKFFCLGMANDIHLVDDNKLLICGYKEATNRKKYKLYEYDFINNHYQYILANEIAYGYKSYQKFRHDYLDRISYIGAVHYFDYTNDYIYLVWKGDLKIIKIDRRTKKYDDFGHKTENFVKPQVTPEIRKAYDERKNRLIYQLRKEMSFVKDIFVLKSNNIGVIYVGPFKKDKQGWVVLQVYSGEGIFVKELKVIKVSASIHNEVFSYFMKNKNLLYIMDTETSEKFDQFHKIYEFRIEEWKITSLKNGQKNGDRQESKKVYNKKNFSANSAYSAVNNYLFDSGLAGLEQANENL